MKPAQKTGPYSAAKRDFMARFSCGKNHSMACPPAAPLEETAQNYLLGGLPRRVLLVAIRAQGAGRASAAAIAPVVQLSPLAQVARVRATAYQVDQRLAAQVFCQIPALRLVQPHQRR